MFVPCLVEIGPVVLKKRMKILRHGQLTEKLTWTFGSGELKRGPWATSFTWGRILHVFNIILQISHYPLCKRAWFFIWKKKSEFPLPRLVENVPVVLKSKIFKYSPYFFITLLLPLLYEWCGSLFVKIRIPYTKGCFVPNLVEIGPVF